MSDEETKENNNDRDNNKKKWMEIKIRDFRFVCLFAACSFMAWLSSLSWKMLPASNLLYLLLCAHESMNSSKN